MKKQLITGALIVVIGVSTFFAQKQAMKIADIRADEIYSATVAQAAKALPRTTTQRIVNTPEEKKFLNAWVKQEFKNETYTERTISGKLMVMHEDKFAKDGSPLVKQGENIHKLYLVTSTDIYKVENIAYPVFEELNVIEVSLSGLLFDNKDESGYKRIIANIPEEKIRGLKPASSPVKNWKTLGADRGSVACEGNYCALIIPVVITGATPEPPTPQQMHDYIFTSPGKIKNAFYEQSYGQMIYGGQMGDSWIPISSLADLHTPGLVLPSFVQQYLLDNNINLNDYDQLVFLVHGDNNSYTSYSTTGPLNFISNGQAYPIAKTVIKMGYFFYPPAGVLVAGNLTWWERSWIHETGHALGANHDNFWACEHGSTSLPSECFIQEYGNLYSSMGIGTLGSHFSVNQKARIGWINQSQSFLGQIGNNSLSPLELVNASFAKTFISPINQGVGYVFEFRKPIGLDSTIRKGLRFDGVFVYRSNSWGASSLTDVSPATSSANSGTWTDTSQKDAVLKNLQPLLDVNTDLQFTGVYNSSGFSTLQSNPNTVVGVNGTTASPTCIVKPIKIFNYTYQEWLPSLNIAQGQLPSQGWPQSSFNPDLSQMAVFNIDSTDLSSEVALNIKYNMFNDDSLSCGATQIQRTVYLDGQLIEGPVTMFVGPWSLSYENNPIIISGYNLAYGQHNLTLTLNKLNDGSTVSYDIVFEVAPL